MAQTNYTPISLYYSTTASAVPTAANLVPGELAINTADGKLYYEDSSGVVQVLATKSTGSIGGSNTQVQFNNSGSLGGSSGLTWDGSFLTTSSIKNSALTNGRVTYAGASGLLVDSANLTFSGSLLAVTGTQTITNSSGSTLTLDRTSNPGSVQLNFNGTQTGQVQALSGGGLVFYQGSSPTEGFRLTPTSLYTASGVNVGIGTSSPSDLLTVQGTIRTTDGTNYAQFANNFLRSYASGTFYFDEAVVGQSFVWRTSSASSLDTTALTLTSSGNLGLGVTPSAWNTSYRAFQVASHISLWGNSGGGGVLILANNEVFDATNTRKYLVTDFATEYAQVSGQHQWKTAPSGTAGNAISFTQAMTLDASGNLLIGKTSATLGGAGAWFEVPGDITTMPMYLHFCKTFSGLRDAIDFNYSGTRVGSIQFNDTATLYNVTSDQRVKTNIVDAPSGNIDSIKVRSFDWIADGSHQEYGMVAQELIEIAPYAVSKPENPDEMMGVDYSKLVPMMIKEIQDLKQRIATLENK